MCLKVRSSLELNTARWLKLYPDDSGSADTRCSALNPPLPKPNEEHSFFIQVKKSSRLILGLGLFCKERKNEDDIGDLSDLSFASCNLLHFKLQGN